MSSFSWRYLVRLDGSFWRFPNINGDFDNVTDEQLMDIIKLAGIDQDHDGPESQPCSRCEGALLQSWITLLGDPFSSRGVSLELCPSCDASRPAAGAFIRWHQDPDRRTSAFPRLFEAWETEAMSERHWARIPKPEKPDLDLAHPRFRPQGWG